MRSENLGFTLIELLVVIAIIAILAAVGIPIFQGNLQEADDALVKQTHKMVVTHFSGEIFKLATTGRNMFLSDDFRIMRDQQKPGARKLMCENAAKYYQSLTETKKVTVIGRNTYTVDRIKCMSQFHNPNPGHTFIQYFSNADKWRVVSRVGACPKKWGNCPKWEKEIDMSNY